MPIKQFFFKDGRKKNSSTEEGNFIELNCSEIEKDSINWDDAYLYANSFKQFAKDYGMGDSLSFVLSKESIDNLFTQGGTNGIRIYLAYCNTDNTVRTFAVAATLNTETKEYDDYKVPESTVIGVSRSNLPIIENLRPCPTQCGKSNVLNKTLP